MANGIGAGLGAFVDGLTRGAGVGLGIIDRRRQREEDTRRHAREDATEARAQKRFEREEADWKRQDEGRAALRGILQEAQEKFQALVKDGKAEPGGFEEGWLTGALPKYANQMLLNGDAAGARQMFDWAFEEQSRAGARLFGQALTLADAGDFEGALDLAVKLSKMRGYAPDGFDMDVVYLTEKEGGPVIGAKVITKFGDYETESDIMKGGDDFATFIAAIANPPATFQARQEAAKLKAADDREIDKHRRKKEIDREFATPEYSRRQAVTDLEKIYDGDVANDRPLFADMAAEERERLIEERMRMVAGPAAPGAAPPGGSAEPPVIMDRVTGKPVTPADVAGARPPVAAPNQVAGTRRPPQVAPAARQAEEESMRILERQRGPLAPRAAPDPRAAVPGTIGPGAVSHRNPSTYTPAPAAAPAAPARAPIIAPAREAEAASVRRLREQPPAEREQSPPVQPAAPAAPGRTAIAGPAREVEDASMRALARQPVFDRERVIEEAAAMMLEGASPQLVARRILEGGASQREIGDVIDTAIRRAAIRRPGANLPPVAP